MLSLVTFLISICDCFNVVAVKRTTSSQLPVVTKTSTSTHRQTPRTTTSTTSRTTSTSRSTRPDTTATNSTVSRARNAPPPTAATTKTTGSAGGTAGTANSRDAGRHHASMLDKLKLLSSKNKTSTSSGSSPSEAASARKKSSSQLPVSSARPTHINTTTTTNTTSSSSSSSSCTSSGTAGIQRHTTTTTSSSTSSLAAGTARNAGDAGGRRSRSGTCDALAMDTGEVRRQTAGQPRASVSRSTPVTSPSPATCISDVKSSTSYSRTGLATSNSTFKATAIPAPSQRSSAGVRPSRIVAPVATASKLQSSSSSARGLVSARQTAGSMSSRRVTDAEDQAKSRAQSRGSGARQTGTTAVRQTRPTHTNTGLATGVTSSRTDSSASATAKTAPAVSARTSSLTSQSTSPVAAAPSSTVADRPDVIASSAQKTKPQKVSSDTQTTASAVQSAHIRRQLSEMAARSTASHDANVKLSSKSSKVKRQRDDSSGSLNSDSTASEEAGKSSSNSNNSASSVDSVVCRPTSSCDELDTDNKSSSRRTTTDHIASLRSKKHDDVTSSQPAKVTVNVTDVKPMPPIVRSAYLRTTGASDVITTSSRARDLSSAVNRLGVHRPLINQQEPRSGYKQWARDTGLHDLMDSVGTGASGVGGSGGGGGYMSDGDIVRTACRLTGDDANCGYMSEGGVSLYMKRMQQRFREGMLAVRESVEKNNGLTDDDRYTNSSVGVNYGYGPLTNHSAPFSHVTKGSAVISLGVRSRNLPLLSSLSLHLFLSVLCAICCLCCLLA